ncbi:hypothetical protein Salat_1224600 [Sesamum alatum]|uniref:Uncharacterized protein n=1 Tax=Sesamum alatum TaxID=300844 RepID=A0AAE2CP04_9LAMI|nr:hypothetical protein Salat_1224600 [Sesamum alatum]
MRSTLKHVVQLSFVPVSVEKPYLEHCPHNDPTTAVRSNRLTLPASRATAGYLSPQIYAHLSRLHHFRLEILVDREMIFVLAMALRYLALEVQTRCAYLMRFSLRRLFVGRNFLDLILRFLRSQETVARNAYLGYKVPMV